LAVLVCRVFGRFRLPEPVALAPGRTLNIPSLLLASLLALATTALALSFFCPGSPHAAADGRLLPSLLKLSSFPLV
jgi:hypothetical protein